LKDAVALFDLGSSRELVRLAGKDGVALAFDGAGNLLTNGSKGFHRWPIRVDSTNPGQLIIGPAERLPFEPGNRRFGASKDGNVIAEAMFSGYGMEKFVGGWIWHREDAAPRWVAKGIGMAHSDVSPNGRWVAFTRHMKGVEVFDAQTCKSVRPLPAEQ